MNDTASIESQIKAAEKELADLNKRKIQLEYEIKHLKNLQHSIAEQTPSFTKELKEGISSESPENQKIALFRSLFRGREDVFPRRFESKRTGKSGYQPVCRNEWIRPICRKTKVKCGECDSRDFEPITDAVVRNHMVGFDPDDRYHDLRHTFCSNLLLSGASLKDVKDMIGHRHLDTTDRYSHLTGFHKAKLYDRLSLHYSEA